MSVVFNPFTGTFDFTGSGGSIVEIISIDGGFANSVYLVPQSIDGGGA